MKVQHIAVIFVIIMIPIMVVTSLYISTQIDTITLQGKYDTKLTNALYDAIKAFQVNTINNKYSSVSDSKIRDINASINTFFNSLESSTFLSEKELQNYIPAIVYTLYDGYYICSKYDNSYPENNGNVLSENELKTKEANYGLKPYTYYSCRYVKGNSDFVVNYTLDNAINVYGKINGEYRTLSGYLINPNSVIILNRGNDPVLWRLRYQDIVISAEILTEHLLFANNTTGDYEYISYNGQKIYYDKISRNYFYYDNYNKTYVSNQDLRQYLLKRTRNNHLYSTSAFEYYYNAQKFSRDVITLIGNITQKDAVNSNNQQIKDFAINTDNEPIFRATPNNDPMLSSSTFNQNRLSVIRKSIETNLTAAIANYKRFSNNTYEFRMPKLTEIDWEKITNNISAIAFLQGIPIGHKYYNNYCVITNNNNKETVKKENIYIIAQDSNGNREYHMAGCTHLMSLNLENQRITIVGAYSNNSFARQTVKTSGGDNKYFFMQNIGTNKTITSCYYCIVNATDIYDIDQIINGKIYRNQCRWRI